MRRPAQLLLIAALSGITLGVLSAMAHGERHPLAARIGEAALRACENLDADRSMLYMDLVFTSLGEATRRALEELMLPAG